MRWFFEAYPMPIGLIRIKKFVKYYGLKFVVKFYFVFWVFYVSKSDQGFRRFIEFFRRNGPICPPDDAMGLVFVRNPYRRIVSAFVEKFCSGEKEKDFVKRVYYSCGDSLGSVTMRSFLAYLALMEGEHDGLNGHWRRQSWLIEHYSCNKLIFVPIERVERFLPFIPAPKSALFRKRNVATSVANNGATCDADLFDVDAEEIQKMVSNGESVSFDNFSNCNLFDAVDEIETLG